MGFSETTDSVSRTDTPDLEAGQQGELVLLHAALLSKGDHGCQHTEQQLQQKGQQLSSVTAGPKPGRVVAVDVLRGLTLSILVFVWNFSHKHLWWLPQVKWSGLHVADLGMADFLMAMGTGVALSLMAAKKKSVPEPVLLRKVAVRSAKLIALGLILQGRLLGGDVHNIRWMGVLQRVALVYASTSLVVICVPRFLSEKALQHGDGVLARLAASEPMLTVPLTYLWWWAIGVVIFVGYSLTSYFTPIPGCTAFPPFAPDCNLAAYLDRMVFNASQMYSWPTCWNMEPSCAPFEPEGILTSFGAICTGFLGVFYGMLLITHTEQRVRWTVVAQTSLLLLAAAAFGVKLLAIPINKNLYTPSYICVTSGIMGLVMVAVHLLLSASEGTWLSHCHKPFVWLSMNSIVVYMGNAFLAEFMSASQSKRPSAKAWAVLLLGQVFQPVWLAEGIYAMLSVAFWMLVVGELFRRKILIQV